MEAPKGVFGCATELKAMIHTLQRADAAAGATAIVHSNTAVARTISSNLHLYNSSLVSSHSPSSRSGMVIKHEVAIWGSQHWEAVPTLLRLQIWNFIHNLSASGDTTWGFLCPLPQKATEEFEKGQYFRKLDPIRANLAKTFLCFKHLQPSCLETRQQL